MDEAYFVAWMQADNEKQPATMSFEAAREVYMYRVFRDAGANSQPVTEAMTYKEAKRKLEEIILLTKGSEYVRD